MRKKIAIAALLASSLAISGCAAAKLAGAMAQNWEYQKQIEVLPEYSGLEHKTFAVVVDADHATLFQHPNLVPTIMREVTGRIQANVDGAQALDHRLVYVWQYQTPSWNAMPYGDIVNQLNVDRVVYIDIYEFRLNPPGNRWEWEGVCAANVGVIERGGFSPDTFASTHHVSVQYPTIRGVDRDSADERAIETGVLAEFVKNTSWLFYTHIRPKYPDKYRAAK